MPIVRLEHSAMATVFRMDALYPEHNYPLQAMRTAFREIDRLETLLSRFIEGSDIWRINHAAPGEWMPVSEECHACLLLAHSLAGYTKGAFDITVGNAVDLVREASGAQIDSRSIARALDAKNGRRVFIDEHTPRVQSSGASTALDLGAIGKGFALDRAGGLLAEWGIGSALLSAGDSSVLAIGTEETTPHEVALSGDRERIKIRLHNHAAGASGFGIQGLHVIDPRCAVQACAHVRAWAIAPGAAEADALSTAWMSLSRDEIAGTLAELGPGFAALIEDAAGDVWFNTPSSLCPGWRLARESEEEFTWA